MLQTVSSIGLQRNILGHAIRVDADMDRNLSCLHMAGLGRPNDKCLYRKRKRRTAHSESVHSDLSPCFVLSLGSDSVSIVRHDYCEIKETL